MDPIGGDIWFLDTLACIGVVFDEFTGADVTLDVDLPKDGGSSVVSG